MLFQKVEKDSERYQELLQLAEKSSEPNPHARMSYNELAEAYNQLEIGEFLEWKRSKKTAGEVREKLAERGLSEDDFLLVIEEVPGEDKNVFSVALARLTDREMEVKSYRRS